MTQIINNRFRVRRRIVDIILIVVSLYASYLLRAEINLGKPALVTALEIPLVLYVVAILVWQISFSIFHVYAIPYQNLRTRTLSSLVKGNITAIMAFWGVLYLLYRDFSRLQTFYFVVILFALMLAYRVIWNWLKVLLKVGTYHKRNILIVGVSDYAIQLGRIITDYATAGLNLAGFVPHNDENTDQFEAANLGKLENIAEIVRENRISEVIICDRALNHSYLQDINNQLSNMPVNVHISPNYSELAYFNVGVEEFAGVPLISLRYDMLSIEQRFIKRIFDLIGSSLLLLLSSPLMLLICCLIKLDSRGSIFFHQVRVGERGKLFTMYKFRTMVIDAEDHITYSKDYKKPDDPRVTRIGHWLRRFSLDEIPQFVNVLKGDMSLVGPRPELPQVVNLYSTWQKKRFEVPQGVTGWWQINGRADLPMYEHVDYDIFYIRNYSVWLDIQILAKTPLALIKGRGAF